MTRLARGRRTVCALAAAAVLAGTGTQPASASTTQESIIMDDAHVVYAAPDRLEATLQEMRALGVDRVRVSVLWRLVAPSPESQTPPAFGAGGPSDPAAYPPQNWDRYDRIVTTARRVGLDVLFTITAPAPSWATGNPERGDIEETYEPDPAMFRDFVAAVGRRYSGEYRDEVAPPPSGGGGLPLPGTQPPAPPPGEVLPRVGAWAVYNEPNHPGWLTPSWVQDPRGGRRPMLAAAPHRYRALANAMWAGLEATGHGGDLILLGETAPRGLRDRQLTRPIRPLEFIREMYCLDRRLRPYGGSDAQVRGCPGSYEAFAAQNPALFRAPAWGHHPYALEQPPGASDRERDNVVLADLGRLTSTLDRIFARHGVSRRLPIWLTEYGYQTDPPDPTIGIPWSRHAAYLNEADYIAYRNRRVAATTQFLLYDDGPLRQFPESDPRYWGTFQSGLKTHSGTNKTAYEAYKRPIHAAPGRVRRGRTSRIWGQLRTAPYGVELAARLELRSVRGNRWATIRELTSRNPRGFVSTRIRPRRSGWYRLVFRDPESGADVATRRVRVTVVRPRRR